MALPRVPGGRTARDAPPDPCATPGRDKPVGDRKRRVRICEPPISCYRSSSPVAGASPSPATGSLRARRRYCGQTFRGPSPPLGRAHRSPVGGPVPTRSITGLLRPRSCSPIAAAARPRAVRGRGVPRELRDRRVLRRRAGNSYGRGLAQGRVVPGGHRAPAPHTAPVRAEEGQRGVQGPAGEIAVVGPRPDVLPAHHHTGLRLHPLGRGQLGTAAQGGGQMPAGRHGLRRRRARRRAGGWCGSRGPPGHPGYGGRAGDVRTDGGPARGVRTGGGRAHRGLTRAVRTGRGLAPGVLARGRHRERQHEGAGRRDAREGCQTGSTGRPDTAPGMTRHAPGR